MASSRAHMAGQLWSPHAGLAVDAGAATDAGPVRAVNEDTYLVRPPVFLVADGMGGHGAGDRASAAVRGVFERLATTGADARSVQASVEEAARLVGALEAAEDGRAPGTTLVAATYVVDAGADYWCIASIGDSRVYLLDEDGLAQVSHDHSLVQELVDAGHLSDAQAREHPDRNVVTRALGAGLATPADFSLLPVVPGSRLLLCSDGVWGALDDDRIAALLSDGADAMTAASGLVEHALAAGGRDNATAVVVDATLTAAGRDAGVDRTADSDGDTVEREVFA